MLSISSLRLVALASAGTLMALTAVVGGSTQALASVGCDGINSLAPASANGNTRSSSTAAFSAGDTVSFIITAGDGSGSDKTSRMYDSAGKYDSGPSSNPHVFQYTYTTDVASDHWVFRNGSSVDASPTCTNAAPSSSSGTSSSSSNVQTLQDNITTTVANASGVVVSNAIDNGIGLGFSQSGAPANFGPNGGFLNFAATPKSEIQSRTDEAFSSLAYADKGQKTSHLKKGSPEFAREWSAWADIRGTGWKINQAAGNGNDIKGNQINLTAGIGHKLATDTLVGIVMGYENFKYDVASLNGSLKGNGETVGGYFAQRFGSGLRFDAALAWTYLNYSANSGTATGSFNANRWLATTGLTGNHMFGAYLFEPSAKLYVLWEREQAWTDSLGTLQNSRNFNAGRTALGFKVARSVGSSTDWTFTPSFGLYGDWRFASDSAIQTGTQVAYIKDGWSGRVTAGLSAAAKNGCTISLGGEYGGLGANFKVWTGDLRVIVPFGASG